MSVWQFSYTLLDAYNRSSVKHGEVEAVDYAAAVAAVAAYLTDVGNITEAEILRYSVTQDVVYTDTVDAGANLDEGATFSFMKQDNKKASVKIPAPVNAIFDSDGKVILTNSLVTLFAAHYIAGPLYLSDGETATELKSGKLDR